MNCPECKTVVMNRVKSGYRYRECGLDNVRLVNWNGFHCARCNMSIPVLADAHVMGAFIARELLVREPLELSRDELLFLRKLAGLSIEQVSWLTGESTGSILAEERSTFPGRNFRYPYKLRAVISGLVGLILNKYKELKSVRIPNSIIAYTNGDGIFLEQN